MTPSPAMLDVLHQILVNGYEISVHDVLPEMGRVRVMYDPDGNRRDFGFSADTEQEVAQTLVHRFCSNRQRDALLNNW